MEAGLQAILEQWLSQGGVQNLNTPEANKYASTRQGILGNFLNQNQYNTQDTLSKNYPWMPPLAPALDILGGMSPGMTMQEGPIPELMRQNAAKKAESEQQANLRQQMLAANMQQAAATPPPAPVSDAARGYTPPAPAQSQLRQTGSRVPTGQDAINFLASMPRDTPAQNKAFGSASNMFGGADGGSGSSAPVYMPLSAGMQQMLGQYGLPAKIPIYSMGGG